METQWIFNVASSFNKLTNVIRMNLDLMGFFQEIICLKN